MARRKWDEDTIGQVLGQVVAELGRMPTRTELEARDLSALWSAMRRNGGTRVWAARAAELARTTPPEVEPTARRVVSEEQIRLRAYYLAMSGAPGDPESHWLQAERELSAAR